MALTIVAMLAFSCWMKVTELRRFTNEFGIRLSEYMAVAVYSPEVLSHHMGIRAEQLKVDYPDYP